MSLIEAVCLTYVVPLTFDVALQMLLKLARVQPHKHTSFVTCSSSCLSAPGSGFNRVASEMDLNISNQTKLLELVDSTARLGHPSKIESLVNTYLCDLSISSRPLSTRRDNAQPLQALCSDRCCPQLLHLEEL